MESQSQSQPLIEDQPKLCSKCNRFFGTSKTNFMCSKCFKDLVNPNLFTNSTQNSNVADQKSGTSQTEEAKEMPQEDMTKCYKCNKKTGYYGFKCKCGHNYCSTHRYSMQHECSYDYKTEAKNKLISANPIVEADKFQKI